MTVRQSIFITGAAAGIGAETVRLFARNGWFVGASDVDAAKLAALRAELGADCVSTHIADVRDFAALKSAIGTPGLEPREWGRLAQCGLHVAPSGRPGERHPSFLVP